MFNFNMVPYIVKYAFIFMIICTLVILMIRFYQWNRNNHSQQQNVKATIVSKRTKTKVYHHSNGAEAHTTSSTTYYITFQVEHGDRMELKVKDAVYGLLATGDQGLLIFQGSRYLDFRL